MKKTGDCCLVHPEAKKVNAVVPSNRRQLCALWVAGSCSYVSAALGPSKLSAKNEDGRRQYRVSMEILWRLLAYVTLSVASRLPLLPVGSF